jgi:thiol-disulfide isomerase/thioredoxin
MIKSILTIVSILTVSGLLAPWAESSQGGLVGKKGYDFELEDVHGKKVARSDFDGKIVVLDFWAVWCGPCQISLPFFQSLAEKYESEGVEVVGVHVDDRRPPVEDLKQYLEARKVSYTNLISTRKVDNAYRIYAMPTTYILDRDGRIKNMYMGFNPAFDPKAIESELREMLK